MDEGFTLVGVSDLHPSADPATSRRQLLDARLDRDEYPAADRRPGTVGLSGMQARDWILSLLDEHGSRLADRSTLPGHLTGSALVLDPVSSRVLLMLHSKLGRWLQPGGHADGNHDLAGVALREATEETGIDGLQVMVPAVDLDIHEIPARGDEPRHLHLDLRFVVVAPPDAVPVANHESRELRWVPTGRVGDLSDEVGLVRLVERGVAAYGSLTRDLRG